MHSADLPAVLLAGRSTVYKRTGMKKILRPARRRNEAFTQFFLEKIAGVQRAAPSGAVHTGPPAAQARESRGQRPLVPSAQDRPPRKREQIQRCADESGNALTGRSLFLTFYASCVSWQCAQSMLHPKIVSGSFPIRR